MASRFQACAGDEVQNSVKVQTARAAFRARRVVFAVQRAGTHTLRPISSSPGLADSGRCAEDETQHSDPAVHCQQLPSPAALQ